MGHWPMLLAYAALPWVFDAARRLRYQEPALPALTLWLALASLSAFGGLMAAAVAVAATADRSRAAWRRVGLVVLVAACGQRALAGRRGCARRRVPARIRRAWLRSRLGRRASCQWPWPLLGLGGIWNGEVVPNSRMGWAAPVMLGVWGLVCLAGAAVGSVPATRRCNEPAGPGGGGARRRTGWSLGSGPGRGSRVGGPGRGTGPGRLALHGLLAPAAASLFGVGAARLAVLARRWGDGPVLPGPWPCPRCWLRPSCCPIWGGAWQGGWTRSSIPGLSSVLGACLPTGQRRSTEPPRPPVRPLPGAGWNACRRVIDPLGRYLRDDYLASDELYVGGDRGSRGRTPVLVRCPEAASQCSRAGRLGDGVGCGRGPVAWWWTRRRGALAGELASPRQAGSSRSGRSPRDPARVSTPVDVRRRADASWWRWRPPGRPTSATLVLPLVSRRVRLTSEGRAGRGDSCYI